MAKPDSGPLFSYKLLRLDSDTLLAIADLSILGKTFEEGDLNLFVSSEFYHEKTCNLSKASKLLESATIVNAVGKDIISLLIKNKLVEKDKVLTIGGIPHAQIVSL